jgi:hypothetical protein
MEVRIFHDLATAKLEVYNHVYGGKLDSDRERHCNSEHPMTLDESMRRDDIDGPDNLCSAKGGHATRRGTRFSGFRHAAGIREEVVGLEQWPENN